MLIPGVLAPLLLILAQQQFAPPTPSQSVLVPILVALVSGTGSGWLAIWYRQRKVGDQEREEIISRASKQVVEGAEVLLQQYREDLTEARQAIMALQEQLKQANKRIDQLQFALSRAEGDRDRLAKELDDAHERRGAMQARLDALQDRVHSLEALVGKNPGHEPTRDQL